MLSGDRRCRRRRQLLFVGMIVNVMVYYKLFVVLIQLIVVLIFRNHFVLYKDVEQYQSKTQKQNIESMRKESF